MFYQVTNILFSSYLPLIFAVLPAVFNLSFLFVLSLILSAAYGRQQLILRPPWDHPPGQNSTIRWISSTFCKWDFTFKTHKSHPFQLFAVSFVLPFGGFWWTLYFCKTLKCTFNKRILFFTTWQQILSGSEPAWWIISIILVVCMFLFAVSARTVLNATLYVITVALYL